MDKFEVAVIVSVALFACITLIFVVVNELGCRALEQENKAIREELAKISTPPPQKPDSCTKS